MEVLRVHIHRRLLELALRISFYEMADNSEDVLRPPMGSRLRWLGLLLARVVLVAVLVSALIDKFGFGAVYDLLVFCVQRVEFLLPHLRLLVLLTLILLLLHLPRFRILLRGVVVC
ncbi:hypothetical protein B0H15DRAFT_859951 [Mycena belliarum]|uniref:Uncharacterized protein n=1 Tax=Mycena belliarum TaxID=1033014 RepID=A0AAD6TWF0_9AGAR|nr:hypothetical protein B0H15DRAFT_859951 [Mycena belliae]